MHPNTISQLRSLHVDSNFTVKHDSHTSCNTLCNELLYIISYDLYTVSKRFLDAN
jgi:hypothetical protein